MSNFMLNAISVVTGVAGVVLLVLGLVFAIKERGAKIGVGQASGQLVQQGASISDVLTGASELAKSLKDLDLGGRLLVLSVSFFGVSAVCAGVDAFASAATT